jgi:hypothetical protein
MLKKLNYKSSPGPDNIKYLHFKHAPDNSFDLIIELFNISFRIWKYTRKMEGS